VKSYAIPTEIGGLGDFGSGHGNIVAICTGGLGDLGSGHGNIVAVWTGGFGDFGSGHGNIVAVCTGGLGDLGSGHGNIVATLAGFSARGVTFACERTFSALTHILTDTSCVDRTVDEGILVTLPKTTEEHARVAAAAKSVIFMVTFAPGSKTFPGFRLSFKSGCTVNRRANRVKLSGLSFSGNRTARSGYCAPVALPSCPCMIELRRSQ
jgi:hypothetical protein